MKTGRIVLFLMVLSILWCADVFAHNDGDPVAHFCPTTSADPCKGTCDAGSDYYSDYNGGHGHINKYRDDNNNGQHDLGENNPSSWGYWTAGGYAVVRGDAPDIGKWRGQ